jgi:F-type H+-transporting ATPase subunit a
MAVNPFDHVMDSNHWHISEALNLGFHLPKIGSFQITKFMLLQLLSAGLILLIYIPIARRARSGEPPRGFLQNTFESKLTFMREQVAKPNIGGHDADRFVPFLWTIFLYVLFNNLLGMLPFFGAPTASISTTAALAVCAFFAIHVGGMVKLGVLPYLKTFVPHVEGPLLIRVLLTVIMVPIEIIGPFIKAFVLAVRLFANMFAGHTVTAVILGFIVMVKASSLFWPVTIGSVLMVTALNLLELFVAFLQAFIFVFLTSLLIGSALHPAH